MDSVEVALRTIRLQNWAAIAALVSILVVPIVLARLAVRFGKTHRRWQAVVTSLAVGATSLCYIALALVFAVCWGGEIGESGKDRLARAYGAPVVAALSAYHLKAGRYPAKLEDLVPTFLSAVDLRAPEAGPLRYPFEYSADGSKFALTVRYTGPGMNTCVYTEGQPWRCGGYF